MRLLKLTLLAALGATLIPTTATARPAGRCAALAGRDLAPGPGQRAVLRGSTLHFCVRGGRVRRLGGSPDVRAADGRLLLLHRAGVVEALDVGTARRARLGTVAEIVHAVPVSSAGVAAVRRTAAGDAVVVAAPGRAEHVVEQGAAPVDAFRVDGGIAWERAGLAQHAQLPSRALRCGDLRGFDWLAGPGRVVSRGRRSAEHYVGCAGPPDAPTFYVAANRVGRLPYDAHAGLWLLLSASSGSGRYHYSVAWSTLDLATGRSEVLGHHSGGYLAEPTGTQLLGHVLLADGRLVTLMEDDWSGGVAQRSVVAVRGPGMAAVELERTEHGAPMATDLRVEGEVVRWKVGAEERSAPLPGLG